MAAVVVDSVEELWEREKVVWHDYSYYTDMEVRNIIGKLGKYFENIPSNVVAASAAEEITIPTGNQRKLVEGRHPRRSMKKPVQLYGPPDYVCQGQFSTIKEQQGWLNFARKLLAG